MSTGTNKERLTQNNGIITDNNADLNALKTKINNLPTSGDTTATANDIALGKTAVSKGVKITGTYTPPTVSLQSKDVTINQNGTTTIEADTGYDGLSDVDVTVNVSIPTPTLELYDVLEINHSIGSMFDTGYIANENTEIVVEYEDWYNYASQTKSAYLFGIRYGTKTNRNTDSITTSSAFSFNSYYRGSYKFGDKEITSTQMDLFEKNRLKLNQNGIYKYDYTNEDYNLVQSFQTAPTWTNMQDSLIMFGEKQILTVTGAGETYINYVNVVPVQMKFHFMEIYENGVLKARYVPAKYGNEIGVYDTVAQKMLDRITPLDVYNENN